MNVILPLRNITVVLLQKLHFTQGRIMNLGNAANNPTQLPKRVALSREHLEFAIRKSIRDNNQDKLMELIRQSLQLNNPIPEELIATVLSHMRDAHPEAAFEPPLQFLRARLYWSQGSIDNALHLMEELHEISDKDIQLYCRNMFYSLIQDAFDVKSEAVLRKTCATIEKLNEFTVLESLWQRLFLSQWFSDQQLANNLFSRHNCLRISFSLQKNYFTFLLLKDHDIDAVYRLIELLLAHDMLPECKNVLGLLFDYQFWRQDLRSCSEIIQTSIGLGLELEKDPNYGRKLIHLLLSPKERKPAAKVISKEVPKIEFKF